MASAFEKFTNMLLDAWYEGEMGGFDGCDIQEIGIKAGVLKSVTVTEPCCEFDDEGCHPSCACASIGEFPMQCIRRELKEQK